MQYTAHYLIEARPALHDHLGSLNDAGLTDLADLLTEPEMYSKEEGGRTFVGEQYHVSTMKLLFLAQVREYTPLASDAAFEKVFGSPRLSTELFDRWWTIQRLLVSDNAESLYPLLKGVLHLVDRTDDVDVNAWLEWVGNRDFR